MKNKISIVIILLSIFGLIGCNGSDSYYYEQGKLEEADTRIEGMIVSDSGNLYAVDKNGKLEISSSANELIKSVDLELPEDIKLIIKGLGVDFEENIYLDLYQVGSNISEVERIHGIWKFSDNGSKIGEVSVKENDSMGYPRGDLNQIYITENQEYVYVNDNTLLLMVDANGNKIQRLVDEKILDYQIVGQTLFAVTKSENTTYLTKKNLENGNVDFKVKVDEDVNFAKFSYNLSLDSFVYVSDRMVLEIYDSTGEKSDTLGDGLDFPILLNNIQLGKIILSDMGSVIVAGNTLLSNDLRPFRVAINKINGKKPESQKDVINVGVNNEEEQYKIRAIATEFMKDNPNVIIKVNNYNYNKEHTSDYLKKISTEMLTGEGDDLIPTRYLPMRKFMKNGIFYDISEFLTKDNNGFYQNILDGFSYNEHVYALPYSFTFSGLVVDDDLIKHIVPGEKFEQLSRIDFISLLKEVKEENGYPSLASIDKLELLKTLYLPYADKWIDYQTSTTNFNSESFELFLKDVAIIIDEQLISEELNKLEALRTGRDEEVYFELNPTIEFYGAGSIADMRNFREHFKILPIPGDVDSNDSTFCASGYSMSQNVENKEIAFSFMKLVAQTYGLDSHFHAFNPIVDINEGLIDELSKAEKNPYIYLTDEITLYNHPISDDFATELKKEFENITINANMDPQVEEVITTFFGKYVNGEIDENELMTILDTKIQTYLKE